MNEINFARAAVANFRQKAACHHQVIPSEVDEILKRLEKDELVDYEGTTQVGRVSAAIVRLIPAEIRNDPSNWTNLWTEAVTAGSGTGIDTLPPRPDHLVGWVVEAVMVAKYGEKLPAGLEEVSREFERLAANARELANKVRELGVSDPEVEGINSAERRRRLDAQAVVESLPRIADYFDNLRETASGMPARLHVRRKQHSEIDALLRALRFLAERVKANSVKKREAVIWLAEAALGVGIDPVKAKDALRVRSRGHS